MTILLTSKRIIRILKSRINKSFIYLLILYFASILGFGKFILIAYFQEPSNFGKFASLIGILTFIGSLISFGEIEQTIKKYINKEKIKNRFEKVQIQSQKAIDFHLKIITSDSFEATHLWL